MVLFQKAGAVIVLAIILTGCGSNYHLRRANHHIKKAELKGAVWSSDTLFKRLDFTVPPVKVEFTPRPLIYNQPMIFEKDCVRTEVTIRPPLKAGEVPIIEVKTDIKERKFTKDVPVKVNKTIKAKNRWQNIIYAFILGLVIGFVLCLFFYNRTGGKVQIDLSDVTKRKN